MENEELNKSIELEQLRSEYAVLKSKLENQEIINERLLKLSMKDKVRTLDFQERMEYVCCVFVVLISPLSFHYGLHASWWFVGATVLMMGVCAFFTWKFHRNVKARDMEGQDLLTIAKNTKQLKEDYYKWIKWGALMLVAWLGWLVAEIFINVEDHRLAIVMTISIGIGVLVGGIIGFAQLRKIVRTCDDIISQIEK